MPLHAHDPVPFAFQFHAFDDSFRRTCRHSQSGSRPINRLMMAAVDLHMVGACEPRQPASALERRVMLRITLLYSRRQIRIAVNFVPWFLRRNVLHQSSALMHIQNLTSVANRQHRFVFANRVVQNRAVRPVALRIKRLGLRVAHSPVSAGFYVRRASRQNKSIQPLDLLRQLSAGWFRETSIGSAPARRRASK